MKKFFALLIFAAGAFSLGAQTTDPFQIYLDSIESALQYQTGKVELSNGVAGIEIPQGFKFLNPEQSRFVLTDLWGNMPDDRTLGMLFPEAMSPTDSTSWAFVVTFDELGYVKDKDADDMNYDELLVEMKADIRLESEQRVAMGYEPVSLIGWASAPFYDKQSKALHWAKELQFGYGSPLTLNYDIRLLGRRGVLSFNAVGGMDQLELIQPEIPKIIAGVTFSEGHRYADFDPGIDQVAAVTIGGLVAGKVLAKVGVFAGLAKFGKVIIIGLLALAGGLVKFFRGKKQSV